MGFYEVALVSTQNAARTAAEFTSRSTIYAADQTDACTYALRELQAMHNVRSLATCSASPLIVTATQVTGVDGNPASQVSDPMAYLTPPSPCASSGGCSAANCPAGSLPLTESSTTTLQPGTYCGGIFVSHGTTLSTEQIWGDSSAKFEGTIYFPKSKIEFGGNSSMSTANYTIIVGWQVTVQGDSTLNANYSALPGGNPSNDWVAMVE